MSRKQNKFIAAIGYVMIIFLIFKSIWDIDIVVGSLLSGGRILVYGGFINTLDFYHMALIRLIVGFFICVVITLYMILTKDESEYEQESEYANDK